MLFLRKFLWLFIFLFICSNIGAKENKKVYTLDTKNSVVSFSTIKKKYIVEPAIFKVIEGSISLMGDIDITIDIGKLTTGDIRRDLKLKQVFLGDKRFTKAKITSKISPKFVNSIINYKQKKLPATIEFFGIKRKENINFIISKTTQKRFLVASMEPIIINLGDYSFPIYILSTLSQAIKGGSISTEMAFNFVLTFKPSL
jgi:hypothetical protein